MAAPILVSLFWLGFALCPSFARTDCRTNGSDFAVVNFTLHQLPLTWQEAAQLCEVEGGKLLHKLNCQTVMSLQQKAKQMKTLNCSWWVGHNVTDIPGFDNSYGSVYTDNDFCPYIVMDPVFHVEISSDCSRRLGFICALGQTEEFVLISRSPSFTVKPLASGRKKRDSPLDLSSVEVDQQLAEMTSDVANFDDLAQTASDLLQKMEQGQVEATFSQKMQYLQAILNASYQVSQNDNNIQLAFNCTSGMFLFSTVACGSAILSNSQQSEMSFLVLQIYEQLSFFVSDSKQVTTITTPLVTIYSVRQTTDQLANSIMGVQGQGPVIMIPSLAAFGSQLKTSGYINAQLTNFKMNPLPTETNENITGAVCGMLLRDDTTSIHISNMSESFQIFLPYPEAPPAPVDAMMLQENTMVNAAVEVIDIYSTIVFTIEPSTNTTLLLKLAYGSQPSGSKFLFSTILNQTTGYRWLINSDMLRAASNGTWYVQASLVNPVNTQNVTVWVSYFPIKCLYWNDTLEMWSPDGCEVGPLSEPELVQCLCNHLTVFGSSLLVMPNSIDLSRTVAYFATAKQNYVVPVLLGSFFFVYLLILIWACRADKQASRKRKITIMTDSHPSSQYAYLLTVYTGHRSGAGTSAKVQVTVVGSECDSESHLLTDPNKPLFERGGVDMFLFTTPFSLGELKSIKLSHDDSGGHPSWYVHKVTIQDLQTKGFWYFLCSTWLSSVRGERMTKRTFHAAQTSDITSFGNIFQTKTSAGFRDQHIWMSVVSPPMRSHFTRAQRVSCCMCLLLCTMAINIMFFNVPQDSSSPVIFNIGSVELTLQDFMVGVESGLLMFPVNILIVTIFRHTKPRIKKSKEKKSRSQEQKAPTVTLSMFLKEIESLVNVLSTNKKNKVVTLEKPLEFYVDICGALNTINGVLQLMQGESDSDPHWAQCSQFVLSSLRRLSDILDNIDTKAFPSEEDYREVQNTVTLLVKKAEMVASSHAQSEPSSSQPTTPKKKGCWLPWWFVFVGWFLLVSISGISTFFTLMYGFAYGKDTATKWVISLGMSMFQSIFVLQPLKVLGLAIFFALTLKTVVVEDNEEVEWLLAEQWRSTA